MAPNDNDHGERLARLETRLETVEDSHGNRLKSIEDKIWWAMVAVAGTALSVLWQLGPSILKGISGK